jgi:hypothetical protein
MVQAPPRDDYGVMSENLALKLRVWWRRDDLDEELEHGADPASDPRLSYRAGQLLRRSTRTAMASAIEGAVREAHRPWSVSAKLPLARVAVREFADDLIALALRLRADEPIDVEGAAKVARLVCNGTSPLYGDANVTLRFAARSARMALDPAPVAVRMSLSEVI